MQAHLFITRTFSPRKSESLGWEVQRRKVQAVKRWPCAMVSNVELCTRTQIRPLKDIYTSLICTHSSDRRGGIRPPKPCKAVVAGGMNHYCSVHKAIEVWGTNFYWFGARSNITSEASHYESSQYSINKRGTPFCRKHTWESVATHLSRHKAQKPRPPSRHTCPSKNGDTHENGIAHHSYRTAQPI